MKDHKIEKCIGKVSQLMDRLEAGGHRAYIVGGSLREALRGMDAETDIDVATDAKPERVMELFSHWNVIETGIRHGTVTVIMPCEKKETSRIEEDDCGGSFLPVEITTFRSEEGYSDNRHPDSVRFLSSIEEDLARRDFTVNAMAADSRGTLVDPFGGLKDLEKGLIRCVGDPSKRFEEDGLRILRALRFASVLDFEIEEETGKALLLQKGLLKNIAAERVYSELKKFLGGRGAGRVLRDYLDVFFVIFPELEAAKGLDQRNPYHRYDVLEHCIRTFEAVETTDDDRVYMKLAALFHDVGKPRVFSLDEEGIGHFYRHSSVGAEECEAILSRLKADRYTTDRVCLLIRNHDMVFQEDDGLLKRWMNRFTPQVLLEILALKKADNIATGNAGEELLEKFDRISERIGELVEAEDCFRIADLAVNGNDIMEAGVPRGPEVGKVLKDLLEKVVDGKLANEKRALIDEALSIAEDHRDVIR